MPKRDADEVTTWNALAIVSDFEQLHAVLLEPNVDSVGAGVECILEEFLERAWQVNDDLV